MPKKRKLTLKPSIYTILSQSVERGISFGWNRAHKHVINPSEEMFKNAFYDEIMLALAEDFEL